MSMTIGILIFEGTEELDFAGPWEVFTMAGALGKDLKTLLIAEAKDPVTCAKGLRVLPDVDFASAPALDLVLVPGGRGTRREVDNPVLLEWLARVSETCTWVTSVCTGALLLAEAGPARGRRITTHWGAVDLVRDRGRAGEVLTGVRYVRDGKLVTSAGVSAGIDMALWLIGQIYDPAFARAVQREMEYDPAPPYAAEV
jgi:transcriptional regulator GlxA family with amidase domain